MTLSAYKLVASNSNTNILVNDPDLSLAFNKHQLGFYSIEAYLVFISPAIAGVEVAGNFNFIISPNTSTANMSSLSYAVHPGVVLAESLYTQDNPLTNTIPFLAAASGTDANWVLAKGAVNITSQGDVSISWAQANPSAVHPTSLLPGSYFIATKL